MLYVRERARADAAEGRCEELRRAALIARSDAGSWKWRFKSCRGRLTEAQQQAKALRRAQKALPLLQTELAHVEQLLGSAGPGPDEDAGIAIARRAVGRLRGLVSNGPAERAGAARCRRIHRVRHASVKSLRNEVDRLNRLLREQTEETECLRATGKKLSKDTVRLYKELAVLHDTEVRLGRVFDENRRLRHALDIAQAGQEKLKRRLVKLRAAGATLSKRPFDEAAHLRTALRRSRRHKAAIKLLSRGNARLRRTVKGSRRRIERLEARLARLRATGAVLSKRLYGRKSERQDRARSPRPRGQQRGAPGHGPTPRPGLEQRVEEHRPPPEACVCARCGQRYAPNGAGQSTVVEIEVKAYQRVIHRPRLRRSCGCAGSPLEVSAPPAPRLFAHTLYGNSVWACFLFERYACLRTLNGVASWLSDRGLSISPGTLADSVPRFAPLFEPLAEAILAHQNTATLRHADETSWRVQALRGQDRSSRAWLWTSVSDDAVYFHIDPSRSAEAAHKLFAGAVLSTVIVCDRYSAYKRMARLLGGTVTLQFCWSHMRRDFIECAAGQEELTPWCQAWIERIAAIYRLNEARLEHYDPGLQRQTPPFDTAQAVLKQALDALFEHAGAELAALPEQAREGKALRSLVNHRDGLSVFLDRPRVPLDNNRAERLIRGPAIGRKLSFGSDSTDGAAFTATMYSVIGTLAANGIDTLRWLEAWLAACAENGRQPPHDLSPWLPWTMSRERRRELTAPG